MPTLRFGLVAILTVFVTTACQEEEVDPTPSCEADASLSGDTVSAVIDGGAWTADGAGHNDDSAAFGLQFAFTQDGSYNLAFALKQSTVYSVDDVGRVVDDPGVTYDEVMAAEEAPVDFMIGDLGNDGAHATLVWDGVTLSSAHGDGGFLRITAFEDGGSAGPILRGCFNFHAEPQAGSEEATVESASFVTAPAQ